MTTLAMMQNILVNLMTKQNELPPSPVFLKHNSRKLGKLITFEGIDGAGKSSHVKWYADRLRDFGKTVVTTRELGGTPVGEKLRRMLLTDDMCGETEALIAFASRREHIEEVIRPALERGEWVISDRFTDSSFAFQGGGRGVLQAKLDMLERSFVRMTPNLTFLFDLPVNVAKSRMDKSGNVADRIEKEEEEFHSRVRGAYLSREENSQLKNHKRIQLLDSTKTIEELRVDLMKLTHQYLL
jgi:dTMP kinase